MVVERSAEPGGAVHLTFRGRATLPEAAECHAALSSGLATDGRLVLDVSGIETCDASFLQLLAAARKSAAARGLTLAWSDGPAPVLRAAAEACGLTFPAGGEGEDARGESQAAFWRGLPG